MTPKEKAQELVNIFLNSDRMIFILEGAKECALIAVDEILISIKGMVDEDSGYSTDEYYEEVKQEIEKL